MQHVKQFFYDESDVDVELIQNTIHCDRRIAMKGLINFKFQLNQPIPIANDHVCQCQKNMIAGERQCKWKHKPGDWKCSSVYSRYWIAIKSMCSMGIYIKW